MQPPPIRKGPYVKTLKHVHTEQVARLQAKNQHECDLLEDIRSFTKQRSAIEKSYADALLKISNAYLNKKIPSIPDLRDDDGDEQWNVWNVWRTVLEENEKLAKARLAAVEVFQQQITDDCKAIRQIKLAACKKYLDQLQVVHKEVQYSVGELDRNKKLYFEEEHLAHDVRDKARDVEEKMKKKKGSIFSTLTSLKRESVKVSSKKEVCEEKSTGARNEYILALAIANAHQDHYYNVDLDECLRSLEADVYAKLKEYLTVLSRTELLTCSAAQNSFTKIRDQAQMLSRDYNVMCCVQYYPVLKQNIRYPFDPCDGDSCTKITCDHGAGSILSRIAKKWATKIGKEVKTIRESQKKLNYLLQLKEAGNKTDPDDPTGPDLDTRIDELKEIIRKADTEKYKAEGVIECLRDGDVNVDEWMQNIESLTTTADMARSSSSTSIKTNDSREQRPQTEAFYDSDANDGTSETGGRELETSSAEPPERDEDIEAQIEIERKKIESLSAMTWDDPMKVDWGEEPHAVVEPEEGVASPPPDVSSKEKRESWPSDPGTAEAGVTRCVAIYTYTAANPDELSIVENEHLELMGDGDESGWVRAKNYKGEEGFVPQNYVEIEGNSTGSGPLQPQISFSSVDYHVQESNQSTEYPGEGFSEETEFPNANGITNGYPDQTEDENQNLPQLEGTPTVPTSISSGLTTPFINEYRQGDGGVDFCRALYDYEATAPEELSFYEGQIIKILRRDDDGWWEGEYDGMTGVFPEIVVEECHWDGEPLSPMCEDDEEDEDVSESGIQPPCYTPPEIPTHLLPPEKVVVTQPTPEIEHPEVTEPEKTTEPTVEAPNDSSGFEMELSGDRQQQYQSHFTDSETKESEMPMMDTPDICVTMEPDPEETLEAGEDGGFGLDVAQIVITAATPMAEHSTAFPGVEPSGEKQDEDQESPNKDVELPEHDTVIKSDPTTSVTEGSEEPDPGNLESQSDTNDNKDGDQAEAQDSESPEDTGWAAFSEDFPREPISSVPQVVEVEFKDHSSFFAKVEPKKASLEIEDREKSRISLGESNESPVTPEELDVQNLAKLESLKESDA